MIVLNCTFFQHIRDLMRCEQKSWERGSSATSHIDSACLSAISAIQNFHSTVPVELQKKCYKLCMEKLNHSMPPAKHFQKGDLGMCAISDVARPL